MAILHGFLAAIGTFAAAVATAATPRPDRPVDLVTQSGSAGMEIRVVAHAATAQTVRYTLDVTDGSGNRSTQSGTARLQPAREAILATVRLGARAQRSWRATLRVAPEQGEAYQPSKGA